MTGLAANRLSPCGAIAGLLDDGDALDPTGAGADAPAESAAILSLAWYCRPAAFPGTGHDELREGKLWTDANGVVVIELVVDRLDLVLEELEEYCEVDEKELELVLEFGSPSDTAIHRRDVSTITTAGLRMQSTPQ